MKLYLLLPSFFIAIGISSAQANENGKGYEISSSNKEQIDVDNQDVENLERKNSGFAFPVFIGSTVGCLAGGGLSLAGCVIFPLSSCLTFSIFSTVGATAGAVLGALLSKIDVVKILIYSIPGSIAAIAASIVLVIGAYWFVTNDFSISISNTTGFSTFFFVVGATLAIISGPLVIFLSSNNVSY